MARRPVKNSVIPKGYDEKRIRSFNKVVDNIKGWMPARDALVSIRSVPTIFPQVNIGTKVGGWPIQRINLIHGPSNNGKTAFALGLGLSFLKAGHFFGFVDAERTTPKKWVKNLMGNYLNHPGFIVHQPDTYESTVDNIRNLVEHIAKSREDGIIDEDVTALIVVDSIRKLVPKRLLAKIMKDGADSKKGSIDGMSGRAAQYKAALNSAWMDELTPLMYSTNSSIGFIGRESENNNPANQNSPTWKLTGGKGLIFDSSLVIRVTREKWVRLGSGETSKIVGEKHCASIHKTKVGGKEDKTTNCYFHTSNGVLIPEGFDRARDVIDVAKRCKVLRQRGGWIDMPTTGETWQGENKAVKALTDDLKTLEILEQEVMDTIAPDILDVDNEEEN